MPYHIQRCAAWTKTSKWNLDPADAQLLLSDIRSDREPLNISSE